MRPTFGLTHNGLPLLRRSKPSRAGPLLAATQAKVFGAIRRHSTPHQQYKLAACLACQHENSPSRFNSTDIVRPERHTGQTRAHTHTHHGRSSIGALASGASGCQRGPAHLCARMLVLEARPQPTLATPRPVLVVGPLEPSTWLGTSACAVAPVQAHPFEPYRWPGSIGPCSLDCTSSRRCSTAREPLERPRHMAPVAQRQLQAPWAVYLVYAVRLIWRSGAPAAAALRNLCRRRRRCRRLIC